MYLCELHKTSIRICLTPLVVGVKTTAFVSVLGSRISTSVVFRFLIEAN